MPSSRDILRRIIEAAPRAAVDALDGPLTRRKAIKEWRRDADRFCSSVQVPSKWYATDGSGQFYFFRKKATAFSNEWFAFERQPVTRWGFSAAQAFMLHDGQLTDRRPAGWISITTLAAVEFGGYEGSPSQRGVPREAEDLDYDVQLADQLWRKDRAERDAYLRSQFGSQMSHLMQGIKQHARL
jgi:hypothetical protein